MICAAPKFLSRIVDNPAGQEKKIRKPRDPKAESKIGLPDLDQSMAAVIGSLPSPEYNKTRERYPSDRY